MALVPSKKVTSTAQDPTKLLEEALRLFEGALSDDQKRQFQIAATKPDVSKVYQFVQHLDTQNTARKGGCVSARLYTFLEAA
ncbi:hypothetical protein MMC25_004317 [Agyrium rufum]|nr:hypothetical protein [Agyrium rufum]